MPRGNLEAVHPRALVLPAVAAALDAGDFAGGEWQWGCPGGPTYSSITSYEESVRLSKTRGGGLKAEASCGECRVPVQRIAALVPVEQPFPAFFETFSGAPTWPHIAPTPLILLPLLQRCCWCCAAATPPVSACLHPPALLLTTSTPNTAPAPAPHPRPHPSHAAAWELACTNRLDLNVLPDYRWPRFLSQAAAFVEQVGWGGLGWGRVGWFEE